VSRTSLFATGALLAAAAVACSSETPAPEPTVDWSAAEAAAGIPPEPDPTDWRAYIDALTAIDPEIVHGEEEKAVDRGRNQCSSVASTPDDDAKLVDLTQQRFSSPEHPEGFGPEKSAKILAAVRKYLCPDY